METELYCTCNVTYERYNIHTEVTKMLRLISSLPFRIGQLYIIDAEVFVILRIKYTNVYRLAAKSPR